MAMVDHSRYGSVLEVATSHAIPRVSLLRKTSCRGPAISCVGGSPAIRHSKSSSLEAGRNSPSSGKRHHHHHRQQQSPAAVTTTPRRLPSRATEDLLKGTRIQKGYELSQDLLDKQVEFLERKYGGHLQASQAALTIQRAFRKYCLVKRFQELSSTRSEKRLSRRFNTTDILPDSRYPNDGQPSSLGDGSHLKLLFNEASRCSGSPPYTNGYVTASNRRVASSPATTVSIKRVCSLPSCAATSNRHHCCGDSESDLSDRDVSMVEEGTYKATGVAYSQAKIVRRGISMDTGTKHITSTQGQTANGGNHQGTPSSGNKHRSDSSFRSTHGNYPLHHHHHSSKRNNKVPPEIPKRTSSMCGRTSELSELVCSPDAGSLSSFQSSSSESSLTGGSGSERGCDTRPPLNKPVNQLTSSVMEDHQLHRLSNISENSNDSCESVGYTNCIPGLNHTISNVQLPTTPTAAEAPGRVPEVVRKRHYRIGLNLFNKKPDRGIQYLVQRGFLEPSPPAVARFLISRKGLSKQMIGEYLGNLQNSFNMDVLECFAAEIDLSGLQVDVALRKFQHHFRMPGEAQKIERIVEAFSHRYCECNESVTSQFRSVDTLFILAFAVIMLNTDLHTPNMKAERRMKLEDYIKNLRGVDDGADIDRTLLEGIYNRIKASEFRPGSDHVTQVMKVQHTIVGKKPVLALPHRRLVCYCRLYEVPDVNKRERAGAHQREVFLFNDLLVITKILSKKKTSVTYTFRQSFPLVGLNVQLFEHAHYPYGIRLVQRVDAKNLVTFNARNEHDRSKFVDDLRESILEMDEMESLRIENELERQQRSRSASTRNNSSSSTVDNRDSGVADMDPPLTPATPSAAPAFASSGPPETGATTVLKRSALSNSLLDIHEPAKPQRRGSAGSLDSGMSVSFQSSAASSLSRESSPQQQQLTTGPSLTILRHRNHYIAKPKSPDTTDV